MIANSNMNKRTSTDIIVFVVLCFLILPMLVIPPTSLTDRPYLSFPKDHMSLVHYQDLIQSPDWRNAFLQSLLIAGCSSLLSTAFGVLCTVGCWRLNNKFSIAIRALLIVPMIIPSIVYALGIYKLWVDLGLFDTVIGVIIAHTVTSIPYIALTTSVALASFDPSLERAARNLGASAAQSLFRIVLPNIKSGVISGLIFAFMHSWDELVIVLFIAGSKIETLPRMIWNGINDQLDPSISAVATLLMLVSIGALVLNLIVTRKPAA